MSGQNLALRPAGPPSPSGGARPGDGARAGNGGVAVDGGRGVGCGDRPSAAEGSVDGEALARGACSVPPNLRIVTSLFGRGSADGTADTEGRDSRGVVGLAGAGAGPRSRTFTSTLLRFYGNPYVLTVARLYFCPESAKLVQTPHPMGIAHTTSRHAQASTHKPWQMAHMHASCEVAQEACQEHPPPHHLRRAPSAAGTPCRPIGNMYLALLYSKIALLLAPRRAHCWRL